MSRRDPTLAARPPSPPLGLGQASAAENQRRPSKGAPQLTRSGPCPTPLRQHVHALLVHLPGAPQAQPAPAHGRGPLWVRHWAGALGAAHLSC